MSKAQDAAKALSDVLGTLNGLRSWPYLPDQFAPPGVALVVEYPSYVRSAQTAWVSARPSSLSGTYGT